MALERRLGRNIVLFATTSVAAFGCAGSDPDEARDSRSAQSQPAVVEAVRIADAAQSSVSGELSSSALSYVRNFDLELGLSGQDDFEVRHVQQGKGRQTHVRMRQLHDGLPVWGAGIVVHTDGSNRFLGLEGTLAKRLASFDVSPAVSADEALAIAKADYAGKSIAGAELAYSRESTELVVYPGAGPDARVAWHVVFFTELQAGQDPGLWNYFIDAQGGEGIFQFNAIHTVEQASGPGGNPKVSRTWTAQLDVEPDGAQFAMNTARLVTTNMNNGESGTGTIVVGPLDPIGDAPINDAHGFAEETLNMMSEWYGHNSIDDNGFVILSRVHYSTNYENAFWDGTQMTYGDGDTLFHPLSGDIDVVGHEINHGFTTFHSDLDLLVAVGRSQRVVLRHRRHHRRVLQRGRRGRLRSGPRHLPGGRRAALHVRSAGRRRLDRPLRRLRRGHRRALLERHLEQGLLPHRAPAGQR